MCVKEQMFNVNLITRLFLVITLFFTGKKTKSIKKGKLMEKKLITTPIKKASDGWPKERSIPGGGVSFSYSLILTESKS